MGGGYGSRGPLYYFGGPSIHSCPSTWPHGKELELNAKLGEQKTINSDTLFIIKRGAGGRDC